MKRNNNIKEGIGVSGIITIMTAIVAIGTSVAVEIIGKTLGNNITIYSLCDRAFYVSLTLLLVELLFDVYQIKKTTNALSTKIKKCESVLFPPDEGERVERYITMALSDRRADKIKIICYGTSKYGKVIDKLKDDFSKINAEIIVCSPDVTMLNYCYDKVLLKSVTKEISKLPNIIVYVSKIPPTIRASLILARNGSPLFCTMQSYLMFPEEENALLRGKNKVPAIVAQDDDSPILFPLTDIFEREFIRLKNASDRYINSFENR